MSTSTIELSLVLTDLHPFDEYTVTVEAENNGGRGGPVVKKATTLSAGMCVFLYYLPPHIRKCHFVVLLKLVYRRSVNLLITKRLPTIICFQYIISNFANVVELYIISVILRKYIQYNVKNLHQFYTISKYVEYYIHVISMHCMHIHTHTLCKYCIVITCNYLLLTSPSFGSSGDISC